MKPRKTVAQVKKPTPITSTPDPRALPRGVGDNLRAMSAPNAQWLDHGKLGKEFDYTGAHIFLGATDKRLIGVKDDRHHMLIAGSRAGKGRSVIINNLLHYRGSVLCIDPKGENADATAQRRAELGQKVYVIDPFERCREHCAKYRTGFNPLSILKAGNRTLADDAALIADALVVPSGGGDTHWDDSAKNFIEGLVLHVATWRDYEGRRDLVTVYELLSNGTECDGKKGMKGLETEMSINQAVDGAIESAACEFFDKADAELNGVLSSARKHLKFIRSETMKDSLRGDSVSLDVLKDEKATVYVCLPAGRMGANRAWLRLFVNLTIEALERERGERTALPVLMLLDEFPVLGHLKQIEDAAGQIAGFGVKLFITIQDLSQLKALYRDRWETFLGNAGVIQCFGNSEHTTTEWISKRLGKTTIEVKRKREVSRASAPMTGASGESWNPELHNLLTPDEIAYYFSRNKQRQIIFIGGYSPLYLDRVNYDIQPAFKKYAWIG